MGRSDAVNLMLQLVDTWRSLGARVTFQDGWERRGNGSSANYEGGIWHHTASSSSAANPNPTRNVLISGRSDLPGPLCNVTGPWCAENDPWLHVIAAFPANHAGASGGRSMGPLPVTGLFNPRVLGLEIDYAGSSPMTAGQYRAACIFGKGISIVLGRSTEYVRGHAETSVTGKWDPGYASGKTIDLNKLRADSAATKTGGFLMALSDAEQGELLNLCRRIAGELMGPGWGTNDYGWPHWRFGRPAGKATVVDFLRSIDREINGVLDLANRPGTAADTMFGQMLSTRALAAQAVEQAKVAATREITVDASQIKLPAATGSVRLDDDQMNTLADLVADRLAARLAS